MWGSITVAKSTGGVRLGGHVLRMRKGEQEEGKSPAVIVEKPEPNLRAIKQLLLLPLESLTTLPKSCSMCFK